MLTHVTDVLIKLSPKSCNDFVTKQRFRIGGFNNEGQAIEVSEEQKTEAIQQIRECLFEGEI